MENLKEYLVKTEDGEYCFIQKGQKVGPAGEWIEIPEGAEVAVLYEPAITNNRFGELFFWKDNGNTNYQLSERSACNRTTGWYPCKGNMLTTLDEFLQVWKDDCRIVWQRDTGLNDNACVEPSAELSGSVDIKFDWGADSTIGTELNQSDINYRTAKAFNEIKQKNTLTEDDVRLVLELVRLVKVHG